MTTRLPPDVKIVSLGSRCEVAWQIRNYFGQEEAYPFDWLVTPFTTLPEIIEEDFEAIADPQYLRVVEYGGGKGWSVENARYKQLLHHEFARDAEGRIVPEWRERIDAAAEKFAFLRRRWRDLMDSSGHIVFVRRLGSMEMPSEQPLPTSPDDYVRLFSALSRRAPRARISYLLCDCPNAPVADNVLSVSIGYATATDWPRPEDRWKGKTSVYTTVFRDVLTPRLMG